MFGELGLLGAKVGLASRFGFLRFRGWFGPRASTEAVAVGKQILLAVRLSAAVFVVNVGPTVPILCTRT